MVLYCFKPSIFCCDIFNLHMLNVPSAEILVMCAVDHNVPTIELVHQYYTKQYDLEWVVDFTNRMKKNLISYNFSFIIDFSWRFQILRVVVALVDNYCKSYFVNLKLIKKIDILLSLLLKIRFMIENH